MAHLPNRGGVVRRLVIALLTAALISLLGATSAHAGGAAGCGALGTSGSCGVGADQPTGNFHGLLAVRGAPWVLADAARGGTRAGCGDCRWTFVVACPGPGGGNSGGQGGPVACATAFGATGCNPQQLLYRIYLTTNAVADVPQGVVCIGGADQPVPIGEEAGAAVERYLKLVRPPDLEVSTEPAGATLAGLPTYFSAATPAGMRPTPFGGDDVIETITLEPLRVDWGWSDGADSGWVAADAVSTHTFVSGGLADTALTTRWGATYTITYLGQTFGPYDAVGQLTRRQLFGLPVHTSTPTLVSR
jgi:hypothetical protein